MTLLAVALVCLATVGVGLMGGRFSRATSDFYVASRSVGASRNASAICGEYLSAASFLGVGGLVFTGGLDMLWFPVGYTVGFLALLVLVAAPLRRSGAYTLPDFAAARLGSRRVRRVCGGLVVLVGWLYLLPLLRGAGTALEHLVGSPPWVGSTLVAGIVAVTVAAGGMRSITLVQAGQYWFKLVALAVPALVLVVLWLHRGAPAIDPPPGWSQPFHGLGVTGHPFYATVSTILGLSLGTMALPHVVIRLYTNADGAAAPAGTPDGPAAVHTPTGVLPVVFSRDEDLTRSRIPFSLALPAVLTATLSLALGLGAQGLWLVSDTAAQGLTDTHAYVEAVIGR